MKSKLMDLRQLIFDTACETDGVGKLEEALKWGQASYLTVQSRSGTTIRIDKIKSNSEQYGLFVHCQTSLIETYRSLYGDRLNFEGNRCVRFHLSDEPPKDVLRHCIALALTYHVNK